MHTPIAGPWLSPNTEKLILLLHVDDIVFPRFLN